MAVDQRKLIAVMRTATTEIDSRYKGYHDDLFNCVHNIMMLERAHERRATRIQKKINTRVKHLGDRISRNRTAEHGERLPFETATGEIPLK